LYDAIERSSFATSVRPNTSTYRRVDHAPFLSFLTRRDVADLESYTTAHQVIYDIDAGLAVLSQELILVKTPDIYTDRDVDWRSGKWQDWGAHSNVTDDWGSSPG
jgi:hypothetical protein